MLNIYIMFFCLFGVGVLFDGFIVDYDVVGCIVVCGFKDFNF